MNNEEKDNSLAPEDISPTRTEQPVDPDATLPSSVESAPRGDEVVPPVVVETVFVKKRQSFFEERPLTVIEMAPRVLRYRTRRDVLLFGGGAAAVLVGAGVSFATKYA